MKPPEPPVVDEPSSAGPASAGPGAELDKEWLRDFYKECGRETTLAYTTLNQMKNWAITVQAAIIASVAAFAKVTAQSDLHSTAIALPMAIGSTLAYVFTLRFFVRAILCYINLLRWNTLQAAIVESKLIPRIRAQPRTVAELEERVRTQIQQLYFGWLSPTGRTALIASNLKLGFGILIVIPTLMMAWSVSLVFADDSVVRSLVTFALGATLIEGYDFYTCPYFDTVPEFEIRETKAMQKGELFPAPSADLHYIASWVVLLWVCVLVALWPWISVWWTGSGALPRMEHPALFNLLTYR